MLESEKAVEVDNPHVLVDLRKNPDYDELNKILDESQGVNHWLRRIKIEEDKRKVFRMWLWWLKVNVPRLFSLGPDGLLDYQKEVKDSEREYDILEAIDDWLIEKGGHYNTLRTYRSTIRSFFLHNRRELPKGHCELRPTRYPQITMFQIGEIRSLYNVSSPLIKSVMLSMIMGGMGWDEVKYWSNTGYHSLRDQIERNEPLIRVELPGRKGKKGINPYYTFLGRDAIISIKDYLKTREEYVTEGTVDIIFITSRGNPLTYQSLYQTWMRNLRKLKLIPEPREGSHHRYGKNLHELRDFFRTRWEKSPASKNVGEYMMGHTIDKLGYNKAYLDQGYMMMEYSKAEPFLNVISQDPTKVDQFELIRKQNKHDEQINQLTSALESAMQTITMLQNHLSTVSQSK